MSTTHIAGPAVHVGDRLRQRCAWCGHLMHDYDVPRTFAPEDHDSASDLWPTGGLVTVEKDRSYHLGANADLPANACSRTHFEIPAP